MSSRSTAPPGIPQRPDRDAAVRAVAERLGHGVRSVPDLLRSAPFTVGLLLLLIAVGVVTGAFGGADPDALSDRLGYGATALDGGGLWRFVVGAAILPEPVLYLVMFPLILLALGFYERRVGAARAIGVLLGTHLIGSVAVAAALSVASQLDWPWARLLSGETDLGISAGTVGVLAAATAVMSPAVRRRVRWLVSAYLVVMVLRSGLLWDAEHLVGWLTGLAAGPLLAVRRSRPRPSAPTPRIKLVRAGIAWGIVILAVSKLVTAGYPGNGGIFGAGVPGGRVSVGMVFGSLVFAVVALLVANALRRGLPLAWWAAVGVVAIAVIKAGMLGLPRYPADLLLWGLVLAALIAARGYWPWRLPTGALRRTLPRLLIAAGVFVAVSTLLLWLFRTQITTTGPAALPHQLIGHAMFSEHAIQPRTHTAGLFITLSSVIWAFVLLTLLVPLLYAAPADRSARRGRHACRVADRPLTSMIRLSGGGNLGWQRTWPRFTEWRTAVGDVAVSYRLVSGVAIVIGDPVGHRIRWRAAAVEFQQFCLRAGWTPCWYAVSERFLDATGDRWRSTRIGEDAVIDLPELAFTGKSWQDVRTARNRAEREGIHYTEIVWETVDADSVRAIEEVSQAWVDGKPLPEMGFTLGTVTLARDGVMRTFVATDAAGTVHGVTTWMPVHDGGHVVGWTLDVMRRRPDGFRPVMEYLIAECVLTFQREGADRASLSVAPLARPVGEGAVSTDLLDKALDKVGEMLEPAYGFRSLLAYKTKFHPRFEPVYLAYCSQVDLTEIAMAIGRAYLPDLTAGQALQVARALRPSRPTASV